MSLPSGYTQLEYIQSSGTQRINTNYNPTQNTRVLAKAYFSAIRSSTTSYFFGAATSSKNAAYECGSANSKIGIVHNTTESRFTFPSTNPFTIDYNKNVIYFNGSQVGTFAASTFTSSHTLYIFDTNRNNAAYRSIPAITLYSFKIYTNDVLQRDYVPCKNQSNEIGLYDVVNNIFYGNAGTGSFVAGAEVKGSHKTLIDGTLYDLKGGKCLVGGTDYSVKKGRTLVNGTAYEIKFKPSEYTITMTGSGGKITYNGVEQNGTFTVTAGDSVTIKARAEDYVSSSQVTATISLNGKVVATKTNGVIAEVTYIYTPSANATITRMTESGWKATQRINIVEE